MSSYEKLLSDAIAKDLYAHARPTVSAGVSKEFGRDALIRTNSEAAVESVSTLHISLRARIADALIAIALRLRATEMTV